MLLSLSPQTRILGDLPAAWLVRPINLSVKETVLKASATLTTEGHVAGTR